MDCIKMMTKWKLLQRSESPQNVSEIKCFTGMVNYYHKFLPNIVSVLYPFHEQPQKVKKFVWLDRCPRAFNEGKMLKASEKVVTHCDPKLPVVVKTDKPPHGLSAIMSGAMPSGEEHPVMFLSCSLSKSETNYSQIQRETTAIYWTVQKLLCFYGCHFTVVSDLKPLGSFLYGHKGIPVMTAQKVQHYVVFLSGINYTKSTGQLKSIQMVKDCLIPHWRMITKSRRMLLQYIYIYELHRVDTIPTETKLNNIHRGAHL